VKEATAMTRLMGTLFWLVAVATALFPAIVQARPIPTNHNETLVRDHN
jgi:hypothetical protein